MPLSSRTLAKASAALVSPFEDGFCPTCARLASDGYRLDVSSLSVPSFTSIEGSFLQLSHRGRGISSILSNHPLCRCQHGLSGLGLVFHHQGLTSCPHAVAIVAKYLIRLSTIGSGLSTLPNGCEQCKHVEPTSRSQDEQGERGRHLNSQAGSYTRQNSSDIGGALLEEARGPVRTDTC